MKVLALGFHKGALDSLDEVFCAIDDVELDTWLLAINEFHYNITKQEAQKLWNKHKAYFTKYDCIITSDTAILSRIFLENGYSGKLIIWICNRFDYRDGGGKHDDEYYEVIKEAQFKENVHIVAYTKYDQIYAKGKGINVEEVILPAFEPRPFNENRTGVYYIPSYENNRIFHIEDKAKFPVKTGRYKEDNDLWEFKAIFHLPYHWNGVLNYKCLAYSTPFYVPSLEMIKRLIKKGNYWFQNSNDFEKWGHVCDFYDKDNAVFMNYFDTFNDIKDIDFDYGLVFLLSWRVYGDTVDKWKKYIFK
jgi:hypothetical protein